MKVWWPPLPVWVLTVPRKPGLLSELDVNINIALIGLYGNVCKKLAQCQNGYAQGKPGLQPVTSNLNTKWTPGASHRHTTLRPSLWLLVRPRNAQSQPLPGQHGMQSRHEAANGASRSLAHDAVTPSHMQQRFMQ